MIELLWLDPPKNNSQPTADSALASELPINFKGGKGVLFIPYFLKSPISTHSCNPIQTLG